MYAVIEQGGKQYKVSQGDVVDIELTEVAADAKTIELDKVLFISDGEKIQVGTPYLDGAKVVAKIAEQGKAKKVLVFKKKKRKGYRVLRGHRQMFTALTIEEIAA